MRWDEKLLDCWKLFCFRLILKVLYYCQWRYFYMTFDMSLILGGLLLLNMLFFNILQGMRLWRVPLSQIDYGSCWRAESSQHRQFLISAWNLSRLLYFYSVYVLLVTQLVKICNKNPRKKNVKTTVILFKIFFFQNLKYQHFFDKDNQKRKKKVKKYDWFSCKQYFDQSNHGTQQPLQTH